METHLGEWRHVYIVPQLKWTAVCSEWIRCRWSWECAVQSADVCRHPIQNVYKITSNENFRFFHPYVGNIINHHQFVGRIQMKRIHIQVGENIYIYYNRIICTNFLPKYIRLNFYFRKIVRLNAISHIRSWIFFFFNLSISQYVQFISRCPKSVWIARQNNVRCWEGAHHCSSAFHDVFFLFVRSHCLLFRSISMSTSSREYASMWEQTLSNHTHNQYYLWDRMKSRLHCGRKKNQTRAISGRTAHICRQKMEKKARENMFIQHNITHIFYVLYIISL